MLLVLILRFRAESHPPFANWCKRTKPTSTLVCENASKLSSITINCRSRPRLLISRRVMFRWPTLWARRRSSTRRIVPMTCRAAFWRCSTLRRWCANSTKGRESTSVCLHICAPIRRKAIACDSPLPKWCVRSSLICTPVRLLPRMSAYVSRVRKKRRARVLLIQLECTTDVFT